MNHVIALPAIHPANTRACLESMSAETRERVMVVDNTSDARIWREWSERVPFGRVAECNSGVAGSWNTVAALAFELGATFVTLCSTSMRFDSDGGRALCATADFAADHDQWLHGFESLNGWHLFTLGRLTWDQVGPFDEKFYPAYFEDNDYIYRMRLAGILEPAGGDRSARRIPWVPTLRYECIGDGHAIKNCDISVSMDALRDYYVRKWGGPPGEELFTTPFDEEHIHQGDTVHGMRAYAGYRGDMEYPVVAP